MVFGTFFGAFSAMRRGPAPVKRPERSGFWRLATIWALLAAAAGPLWAEGLLVTGGKAEAGFFGRSLSLQLQVEGAAPFRAFTLDQPARLVVDFEGALGEGFSAANLEGPPVTAARAGAARPGWARIVLDLDRPLALETAELRDGALEVRLRRVSAEAFAAASGAPPGVWAGGALPDAGLVTVAVDAGHGGVDPGAVREGLQEKDVALDFARDLAAALDATGRFRAVLTREADVFLGLSARVERARAAGADAFLSIHTNAAEEEDQAGAIVFTRSETGSDGAAAARARLENRADALGGLEAVGLGDPVRDVLSGMARVETDARSEALAGALVEAMAGIAAPFPRRSADFIVLGASDMPSVLVEIGFLSNAGDRAEMTDPAWRARAAAAAAAGLERWLGLDSALAERMQR